jgi:hypothetical protein
MQRQVLFPVAKYYRMDRDAARRKAGGVMTAAVYGACPVKRNRATKAQVNDRRAADAIPPDSGVANDIQ